ncbi:MAG: hypothetical protein WCO48_01305 [Candidatus Taylorbacteria bacterium]
MPPDEKSSIEDLKKSLYSRTAPDVRTHRKLRFHDDDSTVQKSWKTIAEEEVPENFHRPTDKQNGSHSMTFFTKLLIGSVIFCIVAVGVGVYLFFNGANLISANNINITINGPVSIPGGAPVSFDIALTNNNSVDLQSVDMAVNFPDGTTDPADSTQVLKKYTQFIGDLRTGDTSRETVKAIMFGEENIQKQIQVALTYSVKGSSAVFTKTKTYDVLINSSPIIVTASSFKEVTSGQEFDMTVNIKSNSNQTLKNILLTSSYPFGFMFMSSNLRPFSSDNTSWKIGDIPSGGERNIIIHGKLQGEDSDSKSFRFSVGAQDSTNLKNIGTGYMSIQQNIIIQKPFVSLGISIDSDNTTADFIGDFGHRHQVTVSWFNNLAVPVTNAVITAHISGNAYDKNSISPGGGYFQSLTDDIIWNQQTTPELARIDAGGSGHIIFSLIPRDLNNGSNQLVNPTISVSANVSGNRSQETQVPEVLSSIASRNIRVSSNISLSGRVVRSTGPFANIGPIPPQAEHETSYTIIWTVDNTSNSVGSAKVTATLPAYVKWLGNVSPSSETLSFDSNSGTVSWNIGSLSDYSNSSLRRREIAFQISLLPGVDLIGQTPILVNQTTLTALDGFTGSQLQSTQNVLLTSFSTDPTFKIADGIVAQ